jgi:hypothetical protein
MKNNNPNVPFDLPERSEAINPVARTTESAMSNREEGFQDARSRASLMFARLRHIASCAKSWLFTSVWKLR